MLDGRVAQVRVVDPHHPLYGQCFPVSGRRSGRGPRLIVIRLPDGRERGISRSATAPASAPDDLTAAVPSRLVHISVRTLLPLANHVRAVLASRHADHEGGGGRDLDQMAATQAGDVATPMAAATSRDTASVGATGGRARATSATAARLLRGGSCRLMSGSRTHTVPSWPRSSSAVISGAGPPSPGEHGATVSPGRARNLVRLAARAGSCHRRRSW